MNGPVVGEPGVGEPRQPGQRLGVVGDDGLARAVPAGHHEDGGTRRITGQTEQQPVHRRVREHEAEVGAARCDPRRDLLARPRPPPQQDHRLARSEQQIPLRRTGMGQPFDGLQRIRQYREGLAAAVLALAQGAHGRRIARVARQVVAADPLDRDHGAVGQQAAGLRERLTVAQLARIVRPVRSVSRGPQAGQAIGWAWKRRSAGSAYSRAQSAHIGKPAMVVLSRSYGSEVTIVNRGPQCVQVMNGCRYRRSAGSASSRRQSSQVAVSGETRVRPGPPEEGRMVNTEPSFSRGTARCSTDSTTASGGGRVPIRAQNSATSAAGPSTSASTPRALLVTQPVSPSSWARV